MTSLVDLDWTSMNDLEMVQHTPGRFPLFKKRPTFQDKLLGEWYDLYYVINKGRYVSLTVDKTVYPDVLIDVIEFVWQELDHVLREEEKCQA